ncbi:hypothetical protein C0Q44_28180 [Paenibacillus sp. PCH8]|uniref:hypothetical protein n=1 Tax=Paenibacillus sp. PCH8 TaxID=2066524 RepID=UPI000CFA1739|nr:hypothetical protein [Paenibacillus sp. PCH8]PQP80294.1 hypothetical protein C0Q44_28180 [Paenibacillus sp. PCH8]
MKFMEFRHKDIYVKVHSSLIVTREVFEKEKKLRDELVYANVIDIDSRVQAVFAQFHSARKASDVYFMLMHAPGIGEKNYDKSSFSVRPAGKYKHQSQREDETLVSGVVVSERALQRQQDGYIIFAWDGKIEEKLFWAMDSYYETPLLREWTAYLMDMLIEDKRFVPLTVYDFDGNYSELVVYDLIANEDVLDEYVTRGLQNGKITLTEIEQEAI